MDSFEDFNINDPKYKKVEDLPRAAQSDFVDVKGMDGKYGFVQKSADSSDFDAERAAYLNKKKGTNLGHRAIDLLHDEAKNIEEIRQTVLEKLRILKEGNPTISYANLYLFDEAFASQSSWGKKYIKYLTEINDIPFFMEVVQITPDILIYASPEIRNNKEIILKAVSTKAEAIEYASPRLAIDKDVIIAALQQNPELNLPSSSRIVLDQIIEGHN